MTAPAAGDHALVEALDLLPMPGWVVGSDGRPVLVDPAAFVAGLAALRADTVRLLLAGTRAALRRGDELLAATAGERAAALGIVGRVLTCPELRARLTDEELSAAKDLAAQLRRPRQPTSRRTSQASHVAYANESPTP